MKLLEIKSSPKTLSFNGEYAYVVRVLFLTDSGEKRFFACKLLDGTTEQVLEDCCDSITEIMLTADARKNALPAAMNQ